MSVDNSMNDQDSSTPVDDGNPGIYPFGALLKAGREKAGTELPVLAATLKVPVKKLEALESGDLSQLPDMVFTRALASSVCRHFGLNASVVLASLPLASHPTFRTPERVDTYRTGAGMALSLSDAHGVRWGFVGAIVCLILALAVAFWPNSNLMETGTSELTEVDRRAESLSVQVPIPAVAPPQAGKETVAGLGSVDLVVTSSTTAAVADGSSVSLPSTQNAVADASVSLATSNSSAALTQPQGTAKLQFMTMVTASWIRVTDGAGSVVWEKTLAPGVTEVIDAKMPLVVVIGRADTTRVMLNGQPYDLKNVTKENVARFEVRK
jgi:cytoskeleton protein RodZ